jgi:hypothetical protein
MMSPQARAPQPRSTAKPAETEPEPEVSGELSPWEEGLEQGVLLIPDAVVEPVEEEEE